MPSLGILLGLHVAVYGLMVEVNYTSTNLSETMQTSASYVTNATSLLAGSSVLSDTATNYILRPTLPNGMPNTGPLSAYCSELGLRRRPNDVLEKFEGTDAPEGAVVALREAAYNANHLKEQQLKAFSLISLVHPLPDISWVAILRAQMPEIPEGERPTTEEEIVTAAEDLILNKTYGDAKGLVSQRVNDAVAIIQSTQGGKAASLSSRLNLTRIFLFVSAGVIVLLLIYIFFMLYRELFLPVLRSSKLIADDKELQKNKGFREMRLLSSSYNGLKERRDALDKALRLAAERDALTGLANRYAYEHHIAELSASTAAANSSLAICIFDVNYLKETNDSKGHTAGDTLLKEAAYCIDTCFKSGKSFRIGGDEFATILVNVTKESVEEMMKAFLAFQKQKRISISYGYAYQESLKDGGIAALMKKADDEMYACKEKMHHQRNETDNDPS